MHNFAGLGYSAMGLQPGFPLWIFGLLPLFAAWSIFWKSLGLWHSAQRGQYWWFIILLAVNTLGILEMIYLFGVIKLKGSELLSSKV